MEIKQLGNGGGLDLIDTNSSFLIKFNSKEYLLFDCGRNVIDALLVLENSDDEFEIKYIKHIFISHMHDDHMGSLQTLIFHNYFVNNVTTILYAGLGSGVRKYANRINTTYKDSNVCHKDIVDITYSNSRYHPDYIKFNIERSDASYEITIDIYPMFHKIIKSYGIIITEVNITNYRNSVIKRILITGDTKANGVIENICIRNNFKETDLIFHDFSNYNVPSNNPHTCESDFNAAYSEDFRKRVTKYHTGGSFNTEWVVL